MSYGAGTKVSQRDGHTVDGHSYNTLRFQVGALVIPRHEAEGGYRNAFRLWVRHSVRNTFLSAPYLLNPLNDFHETSLICFSKRGGLQSSLPSYLDSMSKS